MPYLRTLTIAALASAAAMASAAQASAAHLSDAQYVAAARCQGLFQAKALGQADPAGINALMKSEAAGRMPVALDRADQARDDARDAAGRAGGYAKSQLVSERDGACQTYAHNPDVTLGSR